MSNENQNQNQGNDNNKVIKAYESNLKKLIAVMGGPGKITGVTKVPNDTMGLVIDELFKEDRENLFATFKTKARDLVKTKVTMEKGFKEKEKELANLKVEKYKEFNKAAVELFNMLENIANIEKEYYTALGDAATGAAEETTTTNENNETTQE